MVSAQMAEPADIRADTSMVLSGTGRLFLDRGVPLPRSGIPAVWLGCFHPGAPVDGQGCYRQVPQVSTIYLINF